MPDVVLDMSNLVFAKTAAGHEEIHKRALGLGPLPRRLLVLIDGKRSGQELAAFVTGHDVNELLKELQEKACIEALASVATPKPPAAVAVSLSQQLAGIPVAALDASLALLPPAETRSAKDVEMARNFMMNTINTVFGKNMRLSAVEAVFNCQTAQELRVVYLHWAELMLSNGVASKRLPEFRAQLFKVL